MAEVRYSRKRARSYKRLFPHEEARRRYKRGESVTAIAQSYGVTRWAVYQSLRKGDVTTREPVFRPMILICPNCGGPKSKDAKQCRPCWDAARLNQPEMVRIAKPPRRVPIGTIDPGRVVEYRGTYGVVEYTKLDQQYRWLHPWEGDPFRLHYNALVQPLSYTRIEDKYVAYVGDVLPTIDLTPSTKPRRK